MGKLSVQTGTKKEAIMYNNGSTFQENLKSLANLADKLHSILDEIEARAKIMREQYKKAA